MTDLYLHDIPRPITNDALFALRKAMAELRGLDILGVTRGDAFTVIETFTSGETPVIGSTDSASALEAATSVLSDAGYVVGVEPPLAHSEAENGSDYNESVAMAALALMRMCGGNYVTAVQHAALLAHAASESPQDPDLFYDAGALIARTFDVDSAVQHIEGIGNHAGVRGMK